MNQETNKDVLNFADGAKPQLPSGLNVLTILTFIGCALALIGSVYSYISAAQSYETLSRMQGTMDQMPGAVKSILGSDLLDIARKTYENRLPIMLLGVAGAALCFFGALQMRKLKKQGYILWLLGEVLPIIGSLIFIGFGVYSGFAFVLGLIFPIIFIVLYTVQRKYLVN